MPSLEELEGDIWEEPNLDSHLVTTCLRLRQKPIETFSVEDLRIMIGQGIGLPHLVPVALKILEADPLAEGDYYPGDLLAAAISQRDSFLVNHSLFLQRVEAAARQAIERIGRRDRALAKRLRRFLAASQ